MWPSKYKTNTPLPSLVKTLNQVRSHAIGDGSKHQPSGSADYASFVSYPVYNSTHVVAFRKGATGNQVIYVVSNLGSNPPSNDPEISVTLKSSGTGFQPGQNITEVLSCKSFLATAHSGDVEVDLSDGSPRIFYPTDSLQNSGLCINGLSSTSTSPTGSTPTTPATGTEKPTPTGNAGSVLGTTTVPLITIVSSLYLMFSWLF